MELAKSVSKNVTVFYREAIQRKHSKVYLLYDIIQETFSFMLSQHLYCPRFRAVKHNLLVIITSV